MKAKVTGIKRFRHCSLIFTDNGTLKLAYGIATDILREVKVGTIIYATEVNRNTGAIMWGSDVTLQLGSEI